MTESAPGRRNISITSSSLATGTSDQVSCQNCNRSDVCASSGRPISIVSAGRQLPVDSGGKASSEMVIERGQLGNDEYRELRATIRERGTARLFVITITVVAW